MKKMVVLLLVVMVASVAFAQRPQDSKLGDHDVLITSGLGRLGCQSCHIPHGSQGGSYIFKYALATDVVWETVSLPATDTNAFHTLACMTCHDGATATDIQMPGGSKVFSHDLSHQHPVHETYTQRGSTFNGNFVSFRKDGINNGTTTIGTKGYIYGYVECGTCHDPHKGDVNTYKFLRGPSSTSPAYDTLANYQAAGGTKTYYAGYGYTYTATDATWAKLGLCRDCHGK